MVVGYALGNKEDIDSEIQVLGEEDSNVLTYSRSLTVTLSRMCRNNCPYCGFHRKDTLAVPYSTIKMAKMARESGAREVLYLAGERPDKSPNVPATLDLWGFKSYLDYVYTVSELGFLEGLIPVVELGFLSPVDMQRLAEVCAGFRIMLDSVDAGVFDTIYKDSPGKKLELRLKSLEWAGQIGVPTMTGIMVGIGETKKHREEVLKEIAKIHQKYGMIHEVLIQNFVPQKGTLFQDKKPPSHTAMVDAVAAAIHILPSEVAVNINTEVNEDIEDFISVGLRDLGRISEGNKVMFPDKPKRSIEDLQKIAVKMGFRLHQRFPLRLSYIRMGQYSKKLGQVFDAYRYKLKKLEQERVKHAKHQ